MTPGDDVASPHWMSAVYSVVASGPPGSVNAATAWMADASPSTELNVKPPAAVTAAGGFTFNSVEGLASAIQAVAAFTDPGGPDATTEYTADIQWGDATSSPGVITVNGSAFVVSGSHQYANN